MSRERRPVSGNGSRRRMKKPNRPLTMSGSIDGDTDVESMIYVPFLAAWLRLFRERCCPYEP